MFIQYFKLCISVNILMLLLNCSRKHTYASDQHLKEERRKGNSNNFLLSQAHDIIEANEENKTSRLKKKENRRQKMLDFLHHINKKDDRKEVKPILPPFNP